MAKVKHTKNELKKQKDDLTRFTRYLPTLMLKKKQLQREIARIYHETELLESETEELRRSVYKWVSLFAENVHIEKLIKPDEARIETGNIAGIDIPIFRNIDFKEERYDFITTPLWVDYGIGALKKMIILNTKRRVLEKQLELVREELRITTQRVNLFEKIKIPRALENIRRIRIFLGDLQTAAVVTGKIAKKKIEKKARVLVQL